MNYKENLYHKRTCSDSLIIGHACHDDFENAGVPKSSLHLPDKNKLGANCALGKSRSNLQKTCLLVPDSSSVSMAKKENPWDQEIPNSSLSSRTGRLIGRKGAGHFHEFIPSDTTFCHTNQPSHLF